MDMKTNDLGNDQQEFVDAVDTWVEKELRPVARKYDLADEYPQDIVDQMKELGLFGATISEEYGGLGLSAWTYAQITMKVASVWMAPSGIFNSHLIVASAIERNGTEAQKRKYLPIMATGEFRASLGLTEPNAGSDLQAIRTVAKREGDHYVVNGNKTWITNSLHGNFTLLLVKTDPHSEPRHKGMSLLIAEKGEGYNVVGKLKKMGYRAIDTCELNFQDYKVPVDCLLGRRRRQGLRADGGRAGTGAHQRGLARRGHRRGRTGDVLALRAGAQHLRQADRAAPGDPAEARRHGHAGGRRQAPHRGRRAQVRQGRTLRSRGRDGQARRQRGGRLLRRRKRCASSAATATRWSTRSSATTATAC